MSYLFDELNGKEKTAEVEDKLLLMGLSQAGKTAIKDVVFFNKDPGSVEDYMATVHYERQFIDEEKKSLIIDSGGQESYWNEAVTHFRHLVFSNVKLLLWIIDMTRPDLFEESERRFSFTIRQFKKENPDGSIAVLCHKVDRIEPENLVPLLEQVEAEFADKRFKVRFEATSIYYKDSLKELITELMKEANINVKRYELITNIGQKVSEDEEFQSYVVEHEDDPRIKQLMDYLNPDPDTTLPTYGSSSVEFDLSSYNIIEIVLIDKETFSPITGTSSRNTVPIDETLYYIVALKEFKEAIKNRAPDDDSTFTVVTSSNEKVHALIVDLVKRYLLITSFKPITLEKTQAFYELISRFASSMDPTVQTGITPKIDIEQPVVASTPVETKVKATKQSPEKVEVKAPIEYKSIVQAPKKTVDIEVTPETSVDEEKSMFSFLNKLREEDFEEEITPPIVEEKIAEKAAEISDALNKSIEKDLVQEKPVEVKDTEPEKAIPVEEIQKPVVPDKPEIVQEPPKESVSELKSEIPKTEPKIEEPHEPVQPKSKSRFIQRLREEGRRYLVRQMEIEKAKDAKDLDLSEEKLRDMAQFLVDAQKSEAKKEKEEEA